MKLLGSLNQLGREGGREEKENSGAYCRNNRLQHACRANVCVVIAADAAAV
jgi:hypothetical protein